MVMGMAAFMQSYALACSALLALSRRLGSAAESSLAAHAAASPVMGALAKGQKLGHIFTVLSLTQQAGIPFYRAWRAQRDR
jgi:protein transport protein HofC